MMEPNQLLAPAPQSYEQESYLDIDEAAGLLNVSRVELLQLVQSGVVPGHKLWHGKRFCWKFKRSEILASAIGEIREFRIQ